jgi:hypothetical protein
MGYDHMKKKFIWALMGDLPNRKNNAKKSQTRENLKYFQVGAETVGRDQGEKGRLSHT